MTERGKFLRQLNEAFANSDVDFIIQNVTDDIKWMVQGDFSLKGKDEFTKALKKMAAPEPFELEIENVITHGRSASVNGVMRSSGGKSYAFCDIYQFNGFKNAKVSEMTSYVIELKEQK